MLKEMTDLMAQVSAARESHICDQGHFHPTMHPHHITLIMTTLVARLDETQGWSHENNRKMALDALGHLADICRRYLSDDLRPEMDIDDLEDTLQTDSVSATLILKALGLNVEIVDSDGSGPEERVVH